MNELKELYKKIPSSVCKDGCSKCCRDVIQFTPSEEKAMGGYSNDGKCVHLKDGKCSVYENRAFVCRLFGTSEMLRCEGCTPSHVLSEEETSALIHEYVKIKTRQEKELKS